MMAAHVALFMLLAAAAWAETYTTPDASMEPALQSGAGYSLVAVASPEFGQIVVFERQGQQIARRIVGQPHDKRLPQDADFALRAQTQWRFISTERGDNAKCWLSGTKLGPIGVKANLPTSQVLLDIPYSDYIVAPALGDSLYFVHALNRPTIADGAERTAAQGADSREWGPMHARDFVGVIQTE